MKGLSLNPDHFNTLIFNLCKEIYLGTPLYRIGSDYQKHFLFSFFHLLIMLILFNLGYQRIMACTYGVKEKISLS